ncbi:MAG: decaprenyl-phosphate phosphoribosyltransferase [Betaproteobacteria bacterium]|nr:decaprenyl-phosphate phosphoribosyltransferase [Betaproteobacteria bacterium]
MTPTLKDALRLLRPLQWSKNGFVLLGVIFGHAWADPPTLAAAGWAFVAFCLLASGVYVMNDIFDRARDREHPVKRHRPIASGRVRVGAAGALSAACLAGGLGIALVTTEVPAVFVGYVLLNVAYSLGLKHVVILDVFCIAGGFMLRILAGTLGIGIAPSHWLMLCGLLVTLFLGFAKRRAELNLLAGDSRNHRQVLEQYSKTLLDQMITVAATGTVVAYCLYTVSPDTVAMHGTPHLIYTVPFVLYGLFRYLFVLHRRGGGGDPAADLLRDGHLVGAMLGWGASVMLLLMWP